METVKSQTQPQTHILQEKIKKWVILDNKITEETTKIKDLRTQREELHNEIIDFVKDNHLTSATIELNDSRLKFVNSKTTTSLTFSYINKCLDEIMQDKQNVEKIMNYIKENRQQQFNYEIKRTYNNK